MRWCGTWAKAGSTGRKFGIGKCRKSGYHNGAYGFAQAHPLLRIERLRSLTTEKRSWEQSGPRGANTTGMGGLGRFLIGVLPSFELPVILSTVGCFLAQGGGSEQVRLYRVSL